MSEISAKTSEMEIFTNSLDNLSKAFSDIKTPMTEFIDSAFEVSASISAMVSIPALKDSVF